MSGSNDERPMMLGDVLPKFSLLSHREEDGEVDIRSYQGSGWLVLFTYPENMTPVCATELAELSSLVDDFTKRNAKVAGLCIGDAMSNRAFADDIAETTGTVLPFPILADESGDVCRRLGAVHPRMAGSGEGRYTVRSVFIFSPPDGGHGDRRAVMEEDSSAAPLGVGQNWGRRSLVLALHYPPTVGRSWAEVLRSIDSLRISDAEPGLGTPAGWTSGKDVVILPSMSDAEAREKLPGGFRTVRPYLRLGKIDKKE